jgi:hypothetical protein
VHPRSVAGVQVEDGAFAQVDEKAHLAAASGRSGVSLWVRWIRGTEGEECKGMSE